MIEYYVLYERLEFVHSVRNFVYFFESKIYHRAMLNGSSKLDIRTFLFIRKVAIKLMKLRMLLIEFKPLHSKLKVEICNKNK